MQQPYTKLILGGSSDTPAPASRIFTSFTLTIGENKLRYITAQLFPLLFGKEASLKSFDFLTEKAHGSVFASKENPQGITSHSDNRVSVAVVCQVERASWSYQSLYRNLAQKYPQAIEAIEQDKVGNRAFSDLAMVDRELINQSQLKTAILQELDRSELGELVEVEEIFFELQQSKLHAAIACTLKPQKKR